MAQFHPRALLAGTFWCLATSRGCNHCDPQTDARDCLSSAIYYARLSSAIYYARRRNGYSNWMWGSRLLVRSAVATVQSHRSATLHMRRSFCAAPPRPPPAHEAARKAGENPRWCVTYPPVAPATPEKPFWADAIGMAGFGLVGLQWLMSDMLHLRAVALASSTSMILYNMRAVGKPLVDKTLRNPNPTPTLQPLR